MLLIKKCNKEVSFLFSVNVYSKFAWNALLKDEKDITITNAFNLFFWKSLIVIQKKMWVDRDSGLDNKSLKLWLRDDGIEFYSTHNKEKFVVAERCIRTLKNKMYKHTTTVSKDAYINKLNEIVDKSSSIYQGTIKMNPANVQLGKYNEYDIEHSDKDLKFKVKELQNASQK